MAHNRRHVMRMAGIVALGAATPSTSAQEVRPTQPSTSGIVDAHIHLFDPAEIAYPWLDAAPAIKRRTDAVAYRAAASMPIDKVVVIEAAPRQDSSLAEMRWLSEMARTDSLIGGIVAQARVENGAKVADEIDQLAAAGPLKGIRRIVGAPFQTDPDFQLRPALHEGVRTLAYSSLVFDLAGVSAANLAQSVIFARACPEVPFILNHLGRPPIASGELEPWRSRLRAFAELPNAHCKISNVIRDAGQGWTPDRIRPFVETAIDAFGIDRVLFGSDFPVVTLAERGDIAASVDVLARLLAGASEGDREKLFRLNAVRLYRL